MKEYGLDNNLMQLIKESEYFKFIHADLESLLDASTFIGRAPQQVNLLFKYVSLTFCCYHAN